MSLSRFMIRDHRFQRLLFTIISACFLLPFSLTKMYIISLFDSKYALDGNIYASA